MSHMKKLLLNYALSFIEWNIISKLSKTMCVGTTRLIFLCSSRPKSKPGCCGVSRGGGGEVVHGDVAP